MFMYRRTSNLEVVGYSNSNFAGCVDSRKLKSFISGLRIMDSISRPLSIYCDNSVVKMVIEHISTKLMIAYPLTKGMPPLKFKDHIVNM
uniref:Copia protein n=1 Tax=Vitis vinifera TaxID=29760 RepID=A5AU45_VITVI|nr:hypothetical protein VITISV_006952 [Vitis vinifera]